MLDKLGGGLSGFPVEYARLLLTFLTLESSPLSPVTRAWCVSTDSGRGDVARCFPFLGQCLPAEVGTRENVETS